jgi:hypothetical protein
MSFKLHDLRSIAEISSRGRGSVDPSSWRYCEQFDVVAGSLQCQIDEFIRGNWEPEAGPVRVSIPVDMRFSGEVVFLDRGNMPDAGLKTGQLLNWLVVQRSIEPVCIQRDHLRLTGGRGWRVMSIPEDCGGGVIYERPDALRERPGGAAHRPTPNSRWTPAPGPRPKLTGPSTQRRAPRSATRQQQPVTPRLRPHKLRAAVSRGDQQPDRSSRASV